MNDGRYQETQQKIVDAAGQILQKQGQNGLSIRAIAQAVKSSPANLYEYFANKDAILFALGAQTVAQLITTLEQVDQTLAPSEYLVELGLTYIHFVQRHSELMKLVCQGSLSVGKNVSFPSITSTFPPVDHSTTEQVTLFTIFEEAVQRQMHSQSSSSGHDMDLREQVYAYWSLVHGYAILCITGGVANPSSVCKTKILKQFAATF
ncbi:MAG: TetR/AcrR family transcriptional regulator [Caldilineaceae bacterium]